MNRATARTAGGLHWLMELRMATPTPIEDMARQALDSDREALDSLAGRLLDAIDVSRDTTA